jgi:ATP-dependent protease HslVU (ClpYQ) peptidase subunit
MTVIAWDGETLAADKQSTGGGFASTVTKIFRVPGGLVGFTGNGSHAQALLAWFRAGCDVEKWPKKGGDDSAGAFFVSACGELRGYSGDDGPHYIVYEDRHLAFGAGRDYALAAMYLGKSAREAVEVACALDNTCGMGIDALELEA